MVCAKKQKKIDMKNTSFFFKNILKVNTILKHYRLILIIIFQGFLFLIKICVKKLKNKTTFI